jgi:hypothetical protein
MERVEIILVTHVISLVSYSIDSMTYDIILYPFIFFRCMSQRSEPCGWPRRHCPTEPCLSSRGDGPNSRASWSIVSSIFTGSLHAKSQEYTQWIRGSTCKDVDSLFSYIMSLYIPVFYSSSASLLMFQHCQPWVQFYRCL